MVRRVRCGVEPGDGFGLGLANVGVQPFLGGGKQASLLWADVLRSSHDGESKRTIGRLSPSASHPAPVSRAAGRL